MYRLLILTRESIYRMLNEYGKLLVKSGLTKADLARKLGHTPTTVSRWGDDPPEYALPYLRLYASVKDALK